MSCYTCIILSKMGIPLKADSHPLVGFSGIQFMVFDYCKSKILREKPTTYKDVGDKRRTKPRNNSKAGLTPLESLFSGMAAGTTSVFCTYPLDLARAQLAVLRGVKKTKVVNVTIDKPLDVIPNKRKGLVYVWSKSFKQGVCAACDLYVRGVDLLISWFFLTQGFGGLYRGIAPTMLGILPYSGIAFTINEQGKRQVRIQYIMF